MLGGNSLAVPSPHYWLSLLSVHDLPAASLPTSSYANKCLHMHSVHAPVSLTPLPLEQGIPASQPIPACSSSQAASSQSSPQHCSKKSFIIKVPHAEQSRVST